nr:hypothetical protein [Micromonospora sp. DSM 115978]
VSATSDRAMLGALRRWRVANAPGVTRTAVLFAAVRAAVDEAGLTPSHPGYHVLADNRKYLPGKAVVDGNFSVGVYVEPTDPLDPSMISEALDRGLSAARPLATMAVVTARSQRRQPPAVPSSAPVPLRPTLVVNYMGRLRPFEQLPWRGDATPRFLSASTPGGPEYLTVMLTEVLGRLHVSAGFNASSFDPDLVRRVVEAVAVDPTGILDAARAAGAV